MTPEQLHDAELGEALLKSATSDCDSSKNDIDGDHFWRTCRRCLASERIHTTDGQRQIRALIASVEEAQALRERVTAVIDFCNLGSRPEVHPFARMAADRVLALLRPTDAGGPQ